MTFPRFWLFLAIALPVLGGLIASLPTVDLTYHIRAGELVLDGGGIPKFDTFTFTAAGLPWVDQQWGAQVIFAIIYRLGGWTGLILMRAALIAVIFGSLMIIARRRLDERTTAWVLLGTFIVCALALGHRPQLIGMALFAITLVLVTDRRAHPNRLWLIPPMVVLWANIHGSFFLAPLVLGLVWLEDIRDGVPRKHLALVIALVCVVVANLNPFGPTVWIYSFGLSTNQFVTGRITEWQPTTLRDVSGIIFFTSAFAVVALLARIRPPAAWTTLLWFLVFFVIGAFAIRGSAWWSIAGCVAVISILPETKGRLARPDPPLVRRINAVAAAALVLIGIAVLPIWRPIDPAVGAPTGVIGIAPPGITAALRTIATPTDRLWNHQPWGSWFEFSLRSLPVAIDSRIELFPSTVWEDYDKIRKGVEGWQDVLRRYGATLIAVKDTDQALHDRLVAAGWAERYADIDGWILAAPWR
ncbi:MAG: hypothetical protein ACJ761_02800 [Chloroflexota bacterium]